MRLYEEAIRAARENGFVQNEGLGNELAAQFYLNRGIEKVAYSYLRAARHCYLRWGAMGKVKQLDERYPGLAEQAFLRATTTIGTSIEQLDLATVMKASQAVSGEIVLEKLIETLMVTALEHAGAERGLLILPRGEEHWIAAEARTGRDGVEVKLRHALVTPSDLPDSLLRYAIRTQESVILDDASIRNLFSDDEYVRQQRPRSTLCLPLSKQAKLMGVLYLENSLVPRMFTPKRLAMLELLASQAAISLDHARLYADLGRLNAELTQENSDRRKAEEALRQAQSELARVSRVTTMEQLAASIAHEVNQPLAAVVTSGNACLNWLSTSPPNLRKARDAVERMLRDGMRAGEVLRRVRTLLKKAPLSASPVSVNEVIQEVLVLSGGELRRHDVEPSAELDSNLPLVMADFVQLEQVLLNLVMNAIESMATITNRPRVLRIQSRLHDLAESLARPG